jgi:uncharacterized membrane protein (UPF0127 family)
VHAVFKNGAHSAPYNWRRKCVTHFRLRTTLAALLAAAALAATAASPAPRTKLQAGAHVFEVEVARTPQQHMRGLMQRTHLDDNAGMLFIFPKKDMHCFWMKNTFIPLSIAFLADDGTIVNIEDMQPQTLDTHCPNTAIRYALEVPQGAFRSKGILPGSRVAGIPVGPRRE